MAIDIKPTRSELQKLKQRIKLAKSGYNLLKKKRDGLIIDFFEVLKEAKTLRQDMINEYINALNKINVARVLETDAPLVRPPRTDLFLSLVVVGAAALKALPLMLIP